MIKDGVVITIPSEKKLPAKEKDVALAKSGDDAAKDQKKSKVAADAAPVQQPKKYLIKRLDVRFNKIVVVDYTVTPASVREFNIKLNYMYFNVTDPTQLMAPFAFKSLESVGSAIRALIPGEIGRTMDATTKTGDERNKPTDNKPGEDTLKTVVERLEESQKP